jgi:exodeoxyribonuclease VII large subunit
MAFNEEIVVRAAAASAIPLISAVGHETDTTLIDYASDRRAPTPTAAAEMAVPVRLDLVAELEAKATRIVSGLARFLRERRTRIEGLARGLPDPRSLLDTARQRLDDRTERLELGLRQAITLRRHRLDTAGGRLSRRLLEAQLLRVRDRLGDALPRMEQAVRRLVDHRQHQLDSFGGQLEAYRQAVAKILARGYAIVRDATGKIVDSAHAIAAGDALTLIFHDGKITVTAEDAAKQPRARRKKPPSPGQGSLL